MHGFDIRHFHHDVKSITRPEQPQGVSFSRVAQNFKNHTASVETAPASVFAVPFVDHPESERPMIKVRHLFEAVSRNRYVAQRASPEKYLNFAPS
jgi:hypothetical protein